jgi:hypothetical protein
MKRKNTTSRESGKKANMKGIEGDQHDQQGGRQGSWRGRTWLAGRAVSKKIMKMMSMKKKGRCRQCLRHEVGSQGKGLETKEMIG